VVAAKGFLELFGSFEGTVWRGVVDYNNFPVKVSGSDQLEPINMEYDVTDSLVKTSYNI
jgi:hypothetical protein